MRGKLRVILARLLLFLRQERGIYYVNGPESLPPPLEHDEEEAAIAALGADPDNEKVRGLLIEHNLRLVVFIAKKFEGTGIAIDDLVSIGTVGLIKAVGSFRADKGIRLATFASRCIENEILMYIRKRNQTRCEISLEEPLNVDWDGNELLLSDVLSTGEDSVWSDFAAAEERRTVRAAVAQLEPRERAIIELRYGLYGGPDLTQKEVADRLGISQSYISRLEKRIIDDLRVVIAGKI